MSSVARGVERGSTAVARAAGFLDSSHGQLVARCTSFRELASALSAASREAADTQQEALKAAAVASNQGRLATQKLQQATLAADAAIRAAEETAARAAAASEASEVLESEAGRAAREAAQFAHHDHGLPGEPTSAHGASRDLWDVHVAVHCLKPTGKLQPPTDDAEPDSDGRVLRLAQACEAAQVAVRDAEGALQLAEEVLVERGCELARLQDDHRKAVRDDAMMRERHLEWAKQRPLQPHDASTIHGAWATVLRPLEEKLRALQDKRFVECGVVGYVRSDGDYSWRNFWTQAKSAGGGGKGQMTTASSCSSPGLVGSPRMFARLECVAPLRECHCSLCAARACDRDRMGSNASTGNDTMYIHSNGVGTRVSGVVRVRSQRGPGIAMDGLCQELVSALHEARPRGESTAARERRLAVARDAAAKIVTEAEKRLLAAEFAARAAADKLEAQKLETKKARAEAAAMLLASERAASDEKGSTRDRLYDVTWVHSPMAPGAGALDSPRRAEPLLLRRTSSVAASRPLRENPHSALVLVSDPAGL